MQLVCSCSQHRGSVDLPRVSTQKCTENLLLTCCKRIHGQTWCKNSQKSGSIVSVCTFRYYSAPNINPYIYIYCLFRESLGRVRWKAARKACIGWTWKHMCVVFAICRWCVLLGKHCCMSVKLGPLWVFYIVIQNFPF